MDSRALATIRVASALGSWAHHEYWPPHLATMADPLWHFEGRGHPGADLTDHAQQPIRFFDTAPTRAPTDLVAR